jgi:hypothetical protein
MRHYLHRTDGAVQPVDSDLWLAVLELAATNGWRPHGTEAAPGGAPSFEPMQYAEPHSQRIAREDARGLSQGARQGLQDVPEEELPLRGQPFGGARTLDLIRRAASGDVAPGERAHAAIEILSGPPRSDAAAVLDFLARGGCTLETRP